MKKVIIYTDGSCLGNPGPGGFGALLIYGDNRKEISGGFTNTTNNRMELLAAVEALNALKTDCSVVLYTDSQYVKNGIQSWIHNWKKNNWRTSAKKPVKNVDLWQRLERSMQPHQIEWKWVKGHSGHPENDQVDKLARLAASSLDLQTDDGFEYQ